MSELATKTPVELERIYFVGGDLQAVKDENGKVWVSVRRVCEQLGVSMQGQNTKLKECPWACVKMIFTHGQSGRQQELTMIDLDSLPMWLATISLSKVEENVRPTLVAFQKHAKAALAKHCFGFINKRDVTRQLETAHKIIRRFEPGLVALRANWNPSVGMPMQAYT
jgi:hypothetical protein